MYPSRKTGVHTNRQKLADLGGISTLPLAASPAPPPCAKKELSASAMCLPSVAAKACTENPPVKLCDSTLFDTNDTQQVQQVQQARYLLQLQAACGSTLACDAFNMVKKGGPETTDVLCGFLQSAASAPGFVEESMRNVAAVIPLVGHQSELATDDSLPARLGLAVANGAGIPMQMRLLHHRPRQQQTKHTDRAERQALLKDAFHVPEGTKLVASHFILVDDALDTGSTVQAAAAALHAAAALEQRRITVEVRMLENEN